MRTCAPGSAGPGRITVWNGVSRRATNRTGRTRTRLYENKRTGVAKNKLYTIVVHDVPVMKRNGCPSTRFIGGVRSIAVRTSYPSTPPGGVGNFSVRRVLTIRILTEYRLSNPFDFSPCSILSETCTSRIHPNYSTTDRPTDNSSRTIHIVFMNTDVPMWKCILSSRVLCVVGSYRCSVRRIIVKNLPRACVEYRL